MTVKTLSAFVLCISLAAVCCAQDSSETKMFNGSDLTGWRGNAGHWNVKDGAITGTTTPDNLLKFNTFLIWEGGTPADFELTFQYRIVGGNSGVQYRSKVLDEEKFIVSGYQADIDSKPNHSGMLYEEKARRIIARRGQKVEINADGKMNLVGTFGDIDVLQQKIRNEDWNDYRIVAKGNRLQHFINGIKMSEVIDHQVEKAAKSGVIALQVHQGPPMVVQFKDMVLREVK